MAVQQVQSFIISESRASIMQDIGGEISVRAMLGLYQIPGLQSGIRGVSGGDKTLFRITYVICNSALNCGQRQHHNSFSELTSTEARREIDFAAFEDNVKFPAHAIIYRDAAFQKLARYLPKNLGARAQSR